MDSKEAKHMNEPYDYFVKLIIIGDSAVGKTSLMMRFCDDQHFESHLPTIGVDFKYKTVNVENQKVKMQIWDTAGQEKFRSIVQQYYKGAMGIILTYSVTDRKSFQNIELWMKQISSQAPDAVIILVGNKCDLEPEIQNEQGEQLAKNHNIKFFETSAKTGKNVEEIFQALARDIRNKLGEDHLKEMEKKIIRPDGGAKQEAPTLKLDPGRNSKQNSDSKCSC